MITRLTWCRKKLAPGPRRPSAIASGTLGHDTDPFVQAVAFALGNHVVAFVDGGVHQAAFERIHGFKKAAAAGAHGFISGLLGHANQGFFTA